MRTALLRAVSHDLRSPLAAATAAASGLRVPDIELTAADRDALLDTAGESLELLSQLAAGPAGANPAAGWGAAGISPPLRAVPAAWRSRAGHRHRTRTGGSPRPDRGDARHAGTGRNPRRRADHDRVRARRPFCPPVQPAGEPRLARIGGSRPMATTAGRRPDVDRPAPPADGSLWVQVTGSARCAESVLDPDDWFPVSPEPQIARRQADAAIVICMACPVRAQCLELSLRHWDIGQHGVWGADAGPPAKE
jgi:Transcription factor WhiB